MLTKLHALLLAATTWYLSGCVDPTAVSCPSSQELCNGVCTDVSSDELNCGMCGNDCPTGVSCESGECTQECDPCDPGTFQLEACTATTPTVCGACAACGPNAFMEAECTPTADTQCTPCSLCEPGEFETAGCSATADTQCSACSTCGPGSFEMVACSLFADTQCAACETCPIGQYEVTACTASAPPTCATCSTCDADEFVATACTPLADTQCSSCATCDADEFVVAACTATSNTQCGSCHPTCGTCSGASASDCTTCAAGLQDNDASGTCEPTCATAGLGCSGNGVCNDTGGFPACVCDAGFNGPACENNVDDCAPNPCQNGGACVDGVNGFTCNCLPGFDGVVCTGNIDDCAANPCQNGGTCNDVVNGHTCNCPPGYQGLDCEVDVDDCAGDPCANGGTCLDAVNAFTCDCALGYDGPTCLDCAPGFQDNDSSGSCTVECGTSGLGNCSGHGTCSDLGGTALCGCTGGYEGPTCATCAPGTQDNDNDGFCTSTCATSGLGNCSGHGTCSDTGGTATCGCTGGYVGPTCATCAPGTQDNDNDGVCTPTCATSGIGTCSGHGTCSDTGGTATCTCTGFYTGPACDTCFAGLQDNDNNGFCAPTCASSGLGNCSNHGACSDLSGVATCGCTGGYVGATCATCGAGTQDNDNNGVCTPTCATSGLGNCSNHGSCSDTGGTATCGCTGGYVGATCDVCAPGTQDNDNNGVCTPTCATSGLGSCSNHGTCSDTGGTATCGCTGGYIGATCDVCAPGTQDNDNDGVCTPTCATSGLGNCSNHGACSDLGGTAICGCTGGYAGVTCDSCAAGTQDNDNNGVCTPTCATSGLGNCSNHGACSDTGGTATCGCTGGYTGATCNSCAAGTQDNDNNGVCTPTCATSGLGNCSNHGSCSDTGGTATCGCTGGYVGATCDSCAAGTQDNDNNGVCTPTCATSGLGNCSNHGSCSDTGGTATCGCTGGYVGATCDSCAAGTQDNDNNGVCTPTCATSGLGNCSNHGSCSDTGGTATCGCTGGYTGATCNVCAPGTQDNDNNGVCTPTCATSGLGNCSNHGSCSDTGGTATCGCTGGYVGATCNSCAAGTQDNDNNGVCTPTCATSGLGNCSNHGSCSDTGGTATCGCTGGYVGATCDSCAAGTQDNDNNGFCTPTCATSGLGNCSNHGACNDTGGTATCECTGGYGGATCDACALGLQDNDNDGFCQPTCATSGLGNCSNHGTCSDTGGVATCGCTGGYVGATCATCAPGTQDNDNNGVCAPTCATSGLGNCSGNGTCSDTGGTAACGCDLGFEGPTCAVNTDDCTPNPCLNGGVCIDGIADFTCSCPPQTSGDLCENVIACDIPPDAQPVWSLDIPVNSDWNVNAQVPYSFDLRGALAGTSYNRIGYCLELDGQWVYTEVDDYTGGDISKTAIPTDHIFEQSVSNLTVRTNSGAVTPVTQAAGGSIEMWPNCYATGLNGVYDHDDIIDPSTDCFGSFQVHNGTLPVLSFNAWSTGEVDGVGIGKQPAAQPDWTFAQNAGAFTTRRLSGYVRRSVPVTAGLAVRYDARESSTVIKDGANVVSQWNDLSGNGRHLAVNGNAPVWKTGLINGRPAVDFGGGDRRMTTANFPLNASVTVFAVVQWRNPEAWGSIAHHGDRDNDWALEQNDFKPRTVVHFQSQNDNGGVEQTLTTNGNFVLAGRLSPTRELTSVSTAGRSTTTGGGSSIVTGSKPLFVGSSNVFEDSNAYIGEILYYDRALTDGERDLVIAYLQMGWGIGSSFEFRFTEADTTKDDLATNAVQQFLGMVRSANPSPADFVFFDLPGGAVEFGGYCFNNALWMIDRYLALWNAPGELVICAGDGLDPDGVGPLTPADSTIGYQAFWHGPGVFPYTWNNVPLTNPSCGGAGARFLMGGTGAFHGTGMLSPNYCQGGGNAAPFNDLCLMARPGQTTASELWVDNPAPNSTALTMRVGFGGASRAQVCGF